MPRTYVVTGSASGIGAATRATLEESGHRVVGVDLRDADVIVDLATRAGRDALVDGVAAHVDGPIDAVIACAGIVPVGGLTVRVNYFGAVATLERLRPLLLGSDAPRAVVVASEAVFHETDDAIVDACLAGDEELAAAAADRSFERDPAVCYNSAKRALARWVRRHAPTEKWAGASIPLNAIAPGVIVTPMGGDYISTPEGRAAMAELVPMPLRGPLDGYGSPEQVAALLVWLSSQENSLVTGQLVAIDGGADTVTRGDDIWADPVRTKPAPEPGE
jgi:NAD(P)-dependent dehydrogenase (short-subunit alcohol dehydrogenase family)